MKHSQTAKYILCSCMLLVGLFSAIILLKSHRPSSHGVPYEELTVEEALAYMEFEDNYRLVDLRSEEIYAGEHMDQAINVPYDVLVERHAQILPEKGEMIYLYSEEDETSRKAAMKLCQLDYTSVACILKEVQNNRILEKAGNKKRRKHEEETEE